MLYTVVDLNDILYPERVYNTARRSSNPYDYIRAGYYLDSASLYGGKNNVSYNLDFTKHLSVNRVDSAD